MALLFGKRATEITPDFCREKGFRTLLLDVDNTLALHGDAIPYEGVDAWVEEMRRNGISLIVVSNNSKKRVAPFAAQLGLPFVSGAAKPLPFGLRRARCLTGASQKETLLLGDQVFTDRLGALLSGISMFLLDPIEEEKQGFLRLKRRIDYFFRKVYYKR